MFVVHTEWSWVEVTSGFCTAWARRLLGIVSDGKVPIKNTCSVHYVFYSGFFIYFVVFFSSSSSFFHIFTLFSFLFPFFFFLQDMKWEREWEKEKESTVESSPVYLFLRFPYKKTGVTSKPLVFWLNATSFLFFFLPLNVPHAETPEHSVEYGALSIQRRASFSLLFYTFYSINSYLWHIYCIA